LPRWAPAAALLAIALAMRLPLLGLPAEGAESLHYVVARAFGHEDPRIAGLYPWYLFLLRPFLWSSPAFYAALWGPAQVSLEAARLAAVAVGCAIPLLLQAILRRLGIKRAAAFGAGAVVAFHPLFVMGSIRLDPMAWMSAALLGAVLAHLQGRPRVAALLLAIAIGCHRLALLAGVALLVLAVWQARRDGRFQAWPLRADRQTSSYLIVLALAPLPLVYSALPTFGLFGAADVAGLLAGVFLNGWLVLVVLLGLAWPRSRPWAALALAYPAAYLLAILLLGRGPQLEHLVPSALLGLLGAAIGIDELAQRIRRAPLRRAAWAGAAGLALLLVLPAVLVLPGPLDPARTMPLEASIRQAQARGSWDRAAAWLHGAPSVVLVDVPFESISHPFHDAAPMAPLRFMFSNTPEDLGRWAQAVGANGTMTLVLKGGAPLNQALREVYADCVMRDEAEWTLLTGGCGARTERLFAAFVRLDPVA
jgi:hypothetical protein